MATVSDTTIAKRVGRGAAKPLARSGSRSCVICGSSGLRVEGFVSPPERGSRTAQIVVDEPGSTMVRLVCEGCGTAMLFRAT